MALTLDATIGGANANSYATAVEGDSYHESRLSSTSWTDATTAIKEAALVWATRLLDDNLNWYGSISDPATPQALGWPRYGVWDKELREQASNAIPSPVKHATAELARLLIESDRAADRGTIGFKSIKVGPIELDIDKLDEVSTISDAVFELINDLGIRINVPGNVKLVQLSRV